MRNNGLRSRPKCNILAEMTKKRAICDNLIECIKLWARAAHAYGAVNAEVLIDRRLWEALQKKGIELEMCPGPIVAWNEDDESNARTYKEWPPPGMEHCEFAIWANDANLHKIRRQLRNWQRLVLPKSRAWDTTTTISSSIENRAERWIHAATKQKDKNVRTKYVSKQGKPDYDIILDPKEKVWSLRFHGNRKPEVSFKPTDEVRKILDLIGKMLGGGIKWLTREELYETLAERAFHLGEYSELSQGDKSKIDRNLTAIIYRFNQFFAAESRSRKKAVLGRHEIDGWPIQVKIRLYGLKKEETG